MVTGPILAAIAAAAAAAAAPASGRGDAHWAALAHNLVPAMEAILSDQLPADARAMVDERRRRMAACGADAPCTIRAAQWSDAERRLLATSLNRTPSAIAPGYRPPDDGIAAEIDRETAGINGVLGVYGAGAAPRYPKIDGPDAPSATPSGESEPVANAVALATAARGDPSAELDASIALALALLDVDNKTQAAAFEPLDQRFNAGAMRHAATIRWSQWRYTAIVVPGAGPEEPGMPLSPGGLLRVRLAAEAYRQRLAPFILLTGGAVHPRGTRFVEAIEMARALSDRFAVPADAIVIEPYARHTTTNLRNATRRLLAVGIPTDRPALIVTDTGQSRYIEGETFRQRNQAELGYQPGRIGQRLSPTAIAFTPSLSSLRVDPRDPLDP